MTATTTMMKVLFVDDDPHILRGMRLRLRRQSSRWSMTFVGGGQEALDALAAGRFDVVVSDMRMPNMDGAQLLETVQVRYPHMARIILSGYAEPESTTRSAMVAHQFLEKPCDDMVLEDVIDRIGNLHSLVTTDSVRQIVSGIEVLPAMPAVYASLVEKLSDGEARFQDIASLVEQDAAISAKLLQLVNSSFYRTGRSLSRVHDAVAYLGCTTITNLVLALEIYASERVAKVPGLSVPDLQRQALQTARIASKLLRDKEQSDYAFTAGLLQEIGTLILAQEMPERLREAIELTGKRELPSTYEAEHELLGASHAEIGGYLLGLWGLPHPVIEAVINHHQPRRAGRSNFGPVHAVYVANVLINELRVAAPNDELEYLELIDIDLLESLGVAAQLEGWRELAREELLVEA